MTGRTRTFGVERRWLGPLLTIAALVGVLALRAIGIPVSTPGLILLLTVAIAAVISGGVPAFVSAAITIAFSVVDSVEPGTLHVPPDQVSRLVVTAIVAPAIALVVGGIQARLQAEQAAALVRRSDERQRALTETAADAIITIDRSSTIEAANPAAAELFGYSRAELIGRPLTDLMPAGLRERHLAGFGRYLESGHRSRPWTGLEVSARHRTGREIAVEVSFGEYGAGDERRFTGIVRDIGRRRELEAQLARAQKMEAIGHLAGGVAHDFNNMLTAISGYAELMRADATLDADNREAAEGIQESAARAAALTSQLLAFSRRQQLEPSIVTLNDVVLRVQPLITRLLREDIRVVRQLEPDPWPVMVDPARMESVVMNLAVNARDAMPAGGTLTIETSNVHVDESYALGRIEFVPGDYAVLSVTDTGTGIPADVLDHVFEPFYTTKPVGEGTGLGLATVHGTVNQSGGHVWAYSEPGHGTLFKVYLPRALPVAAAGGNGRTAGGAGLAAGDAAAILTGAGGDAAAALGGETGGEGGGAAATLTGTETVLVVEDERAVRDLIVTILGRLGYRVLTAIDGTQALELLDAGATDGEGGGSDVAGGMDGDVVDEPADRAADRAAHRPALLLSDVVLPGRSGPAVAAEALRMRPDLRILFMSGYTAAGLAGHDLPPTTRLLEKPFTADALARAVRAALDEPARSPVDVGSE